MLKILSLGAGVQSTTLFLMACKGELPKLDAAIFADTQWEPAEIYKHLGWLATQGAIHGIPIITTTKSSLRSDAITAQVRGRKAEGVRWASMPMYTLQPNGKIGMIRRQCTTEYKIEMIEKATRRLLGLRPRQKAVANSAEQWVGISADEAARMRDSKAHWYSLRYPLIWDVELPMTRQDCIAWLKRNNYPVPPKSACLGCPFHSDSEWRNIKQNNSEWADVCEFDRQIRNSRGMRGQVFLHRSCKPLSEIDFSTAEERGQRNWINECSGMCGV